VAWSDAHFDGHEGVLERNSAKYRFWKVFAERKREEVAECVISDFCLGLLHFERRKIVSELNLIKGGFLTAIVRVLV
jgi:hypothetical protein